MAEPQEMLLTPEGRDRLQEELAELSGVKAQEITEAISRAREFGDLSENAEYDSARDEQARNIARIKEIEDILARARVEERSTDTSVVSLGCTVMVEDSAKKSVTFRIVGSTETNSLEHRISNESPLGAAVMGKRVGDTVEVLSPRGVRRPYVITGIKH